MRERVRAARGYGGLSREWVLTAALAEAARGPGAVAVSTHSRGPPYPRAARTLFLTHRGPRMPRYSVCAPFSLQTPVERSERVEGCWAVRARANPLSLGVWHFTLRFVLPGVGLATPSRRPKGCGVQSPLGPKVYTVKCTVY